MYQRVDFATLRSWHSASAVRRIAFYRSEIQKQVIEDMPVFIQGDRSRRLYRVLSKRQTLGIVSRLVHIL